MQLFAVISELTAIAGASCRHPSLPVVPLAGVGGGLIPGFDLLPFARKALFALPAGLAWLLAREKAQSRPGGAQRGWRGQGCQGPVRLRVGAREVLAAGAGFAHPADRAYRSLGAGMR